MPHVDGLPQSLTRLHTAVMHEKREGSINSLTKKEKMESHFQNP